MALCHSSSEVATHNEHNCEDGQSPLRPAMNALGGLNHVLKGGAMALSRVQFRTGPGRPGFRVPARGPAALLPPGAAPKGPRSAIGGVVVQWVQRAGTPRRAEGPSRPALRAGHRRRPARHHVTRRRRSRAGAALSGRDRSCCTHQPRLQFGGVRQPRSQTRSGRVPWPVLETSGWSLG